MAQNIFSSRSRLVNLCRAFTGDPGAAEDLAQDTLLEAWRCRETLRDPAAADAWLSGIARNLCRRHLRRIAVQRSREPRGSDWPTEGGFWDDLEQGERAALLNRAMGLLPEPTRALLTSRYWDDLTLAEIAARAGCTENTAAARLRRAREALRVVLTTRLGGDAAIFGPDFAEAGRWRSTQVWCFRCGHSRLEKCVGPNAEFGIRCPQCDGTNADIAFSTRHAAMDAAQVLGTVRSLRPALRRVNAWWDTRLRRGLRERALPCWRCAGRMSLRQSGPAAVAPRAFQHRAVFVCGGCGAEFSLPASGLAFHSAALQRFWQQNPRLRVMPERFVDPGRRAVVVTTYQAVGSANSIEIAYDAATFRRIETSG